MPNSVAFIAQQSCLQNVSFWDLYTVIKCNSDLDYWIHLVQIWYMITNLTIMIGYCSMTKSTWGRSMICFGLLGGFFEVSTGVYYHYYCYYYVFNKQSIFNWYAWIASATLP